MKGIILAGGSGTRLYPCTKVTSKQLLPIYNKPMIYYPLETLLNAGIQEILIIVAPEHAGDFVNLLGSGKDFGARFFYEVQDKPEGLAQAFLIGESFIEDDPVMMILGDNIFDYDFSEAVQSFEKGGRIFAKEVENPERFGEMLGAMGRGSFSELKVINTLCKESIKRQESAIRLCKQVDIMFVLGGLESANTRRLAELCAKVNRQTFHLQNWEELDTKVLHGKKTAGVTAGASTPDWIISEFVKNLELFEYNDGSN